MEIKVGNFYKTRGGNKVRIYDTESGGACTIHGAVLSKKGFWESRSWGINGNFYQDKTKDRDDIIEEWREPLDFDWDCLPTWANQYVAMDRGGTWFAYSGEPDYLPQTSNWHIQKGFFVEIPRGYAPKNYHDTSEKSLTFNPFL